MLENFVKPSPNRYLLLRFYLFLTVGLIGVAALLDYGFSVYNTSFDDRDEPWVMRTLTLIETNLPARQSPMTNEDVSALASYSQALSERLGINVRVYDAQQVAPAVPVGVLQTGTTIDGREVYLFALASGLVVELSVPRQQTVWSIGDFLPLLFYSAIFLVVGFWFAPLVRDLNRLGNSATTFASDYANPLPELGQVTHLTGLASNIASMAERIRGLINTQQDLTNAMSHEIRTPLARIKFALAVGSVGVDGEQETTNDLKAELAKDIEEIDRLIDSMLEYARLEQTDTAFTIEKISPSELLTEFEQETGTGILVRLGHTPDKELVSLDDDQGLLRVCCDAHLLNLALSNLIVNAARYARSRVELSWKVDADNWVLVRVDDDGAGVPEPDRDEIFSPFSRRDNSRSKLTGGFGLGLAIVSRIASMHGGEVRVVDSPLGGARFELRWPGLG